MNGAARLFFGLLSAGAAVLTATDARAYCQSRTCDPTVTACALNDGCIITGNPLYWPSDCVTFAVQGDGAEELGIDAETLVDTAQTAFDNWANVDCPGYPSIFGEFFGMAECALSEFDERSKNANIVMVHTYWPYAVGEGVLGVTLVRYDVKTGRIDDADIEINGEEFELSVGDPVEGSDLESILTHEVGHLLGLNHSSDEDATMFDRYTVSGTSSRSLSDDDIEGLCATYPPDRELDADDCLPLNGFSGQCIEDQAKPLPPRRSSSCAVTPSRRSPAESAFLLGFLVCFPLARRALKRSKRH